MDGRPILAEWFWAMVWGAVVLESMRLCPLWNTRVNFKNALGNV
jgi:hypothetical protein